MQKTTATATRTSPNKMFNLSKTMPVHVRYNSWYISLATQILRCLENVSYFYLDQNAFVAYSAGVRTDKHPE